MAKKNKKLFETAGEAAKNLKPAQKSAPTITGADIAAVNRRRLAGDKAKNESRQNTAPAAITGGSGRLGAMTKYAGQMGTTKTNTYYEDERKASERIKERSSSAMNRLANAKGPGQEQRLLMEAAKDKQRRTNDVQLRNRSNQGAGKRKTYTNADGSVGYYYQRGKGEQAQLNATFNKNVVPSRVNGMMPQMIDAQNKAKRANIDSGNFYTQESENTMKYDDGKRTEYFERQGDAWISVPEERYDQTRLLDNGKNPATYTAADRAIDTAKSSWESLKASGGGITSSLDTGVENSGYKIALKQQNGEMLTDSEEQVLSRSKAGQAVLRGDIKTAREIVNQETRERQLREQDVLEQQQKANEMRETAKIGAGRAGQFLLDLEGTALDMAPGMALNAVAPGSFLVEMAFQSYGNSYNNARLQGASHDEAVLSGLQNAAVETLSEMMFAGGKTLGRMTGVRGIFHPGKEIEEASLGFIKSTAGRDIITTVKKLGLASAEEGAEELVAGLVEPMLDAMIYQGGLDNLDWEQTLHDALYNTLVGAAMGGGFGTVDVAQSIAAGSNIRANADVANMINQGLAMSEDSKAYMIARKLDAQYKADPDTLGNIDVSDLSRALQEEWQNVQKTHSKEMSTAKAALAREGISNLDTHAEEDYVRSRRTDAQDDVTAEEAAYSHSELGDKFGATYEQASEMIRASGAEMSQIETERAAASIARIMYGEGTAADTANLMASNPVAREVFQEISGKALPADNAGAMRELEKFNTTNKIRYATEAAKINQEQDRKRRMSYVMEDARNLLGRSNPAVDTFHEIAKDTETENLDAAEEAFIRLYDLGNSGAAFVPNLEMAGMLPEEAQRAAYDAGAQARMQGFEDAQAALARADAKSKEEGKKTKKGENDVQQKLDEDEAKTAKKEGYTKVAQELQKALGVKIVLETKRSIAGRDLSVNASLVNGWYSNGAIHLNMEGVDPMEVVFSHEFTHHLERYAPKEYQALIDFIKQEKTNNNEQAWQREIDAKMEQYARAGKKLKSRDDAVREIVADMAYEFLTDERTVHRLFGYDKDLATKIQQTILDVIDKMLKVLRDETRIRGTQWKGMQKQFEEAREMWITAAEVARGNADLDIDGDTQFLIEHNVEDEDGNVYESIVRLETDIFDGLSDDERVIALNNWIDEHAGMSMVLHNADGDDNVRLAYKGEKYKKDGAKNKARVLNKLKGAKNPVKQEVIVNISDLVEASKETNDPTKNKPNNHGWLDKNGWDHRIAYFATPAGKIYSSIIDVANSDKGKILYYVGVIKEVGGDLAQKGASRLPTSDNTVSEEEKTRNQNTQKEQGPFSLADIGMTEKNGRAAWLPERIDRLIRQSGAESIPEYAKEYAVMMNPRDFLKLTASDDMVEDWSRRAQNVPDEVKGLPYREAVDRVWNRAKETGEWIHDNENYPLDQEELARQDQTPFLIIDAYDNTRIVGHEGRHRMRALMEAGITSVPVVINDTTSKYSKQNLGSMTLTAQNFGNGPVNGGASVVVHDLVPINEAHRAELEEKFGAKGDEQVQFSIAEDSKGRKLSKGQQEYFKNSKARDAEGRLVPVYHTTNRGGFTVFDPRKSDDKRSLFFASNFGVSQTYGKDANEIITVPTQTKPFESFDEFVEFAKQHVRSINSDNIVAGFGIEIKDILTNHPFKELGNTAEERFRSWLQLQEAGDKKATRFCQVYMDNPSWIVGGQFNPDGDGIYAKTLQELLDQLSAAVGVGVAVGQQRGYYACYLNLENPLIIEGNNSRWNKIPFNGKLSAADREGMRKLVSALDNEYSMKISNVESYWDDWDDDLEEYSSLNVRISGSQKGEDGSWKPFNYEKRWTARELYDAQELDIYNAEVGDIQIALFDKFSEYWDSLGLDYDYLERINNYADVNGDVQYVAREESDYGIDDYIDGDGDDVSVDVFIDDRESLSKELEGLNLHSSWNTYATRDLAKIAKDEGFDGVIIRDINDLGGRSAYMGNNPISDIYIAFSSNQVKDIRNENPTDDPDIRFSFAGENALNANNMMLAIAKQWEEEGRSSEEIRQFTGWHKGYEGRWRFEIDDSQAELDTDLKHWRKYNAKTATRRYRDGKKVAANLDEFLQHDVLFANYPELRNFKLLYKEGGITSRGTTYGEFNPATNTLTIYAACFLEGNAKSVIMHEIQHAIQKLERFANGSDPSAMVKGRSVPLKTKTEMLVSLNDLNEALRARAEDERYQDGFMPRSLGLDAFKENRARLTMQAVSVGDYELVEIINKFGDALAKYEKAEGNTRFGRYQRAAGEIEARDVQARLDMTDAQRRTRRPDIDRTDALLTDDLGNSLIEANTKRELNSLGVDTTEGGTAVKYSLASWNDTDKGRLIEALVKAGHDRNAAQKWVNDVNSVAAIILGDMERLNYEADQFQDALKNNEEYYYTLDLSTLCQKRRLYQGTYNAIMHQIVNRGLMPQDTVRLREMMKEMGFEAPCGICYEESRKKNEGKFAERWLEKYKSESHDDPYQPTLADVTTTDGRAALRENHPEIHASYLAYQRTRGSANPKVSFTHTDYRQDILRMTDSDVRKVKHIGGLRIQSFSDFETIHVIDMMQAVLDMATKNLTAQAYTKVPAFADIFGGTGIKINLSLIGQVKDGKLWFDPVEGIDPDEAFRIREKYSDNVGTILVGANTESILAAWADPRIDMVIPFHRSGWSKSEFEKLGLGDYEDFQTYQSERYLDGSSPDGVALSKVKMEGIYPSDYWDYSKTGKENAEEYLRLCAEKHYRPVFYNFLQDNGDGTWSLKDDGSTDGYWKSLIDYKMYNNEGVGAPQREVWPNFDMEVAEQTMAKYEGNADTLPVAQEVVDRFLDEYRTTHPEVQFSLSEDTEGHALTAAQQSFFKDSKIRDEQGRLKVMYHGTNNEFTVFDFSQGGKNGTAEGYGIYTADSREVSEHYGERLIEGYVNMRRPADQNAVQTLTRPELRKLIRATIDDEVEHWGMDERDTWISNYTNTYESSIESSIDSVIETITRFNGNDFDIVQEVMSGMGIRDYDAAIRFYDILTSSTGIDGFVTKWGDESDPNAPVIALAFRSNQIKNVTNENPTEDPDIRYSIASDEEYLNAVRNGDTATAQRMVDEAAKRAGYDTKAYHSTDKLFNEFKYGADLKGDTSYLNAYYYFSANKAWSKAYAREERYIPANKVKTQEVYLKMGNVLDLSDYGRLTFPEWTKVLEDKGVEITESIRKHHIGAGAEDANSAKRMFWEYIRYDINSGEYESNWKKAFIDAGYDSIHIRDTMRGRGGIPGDTFVVFDPNQVKSAKAVVRDDKRKVIPLSKRFDDRIPDLRFSLASDRNMEIADLRKKVERLQRDKKRTYGRVASDADARRVARALLADTSSDFSLNQTINAVKELFTMIKRGDDFADIYGYAQGIARSIADSSYDMVEIPGASDLADLRQRFLDTRKRQNGSPLKIMIPQNLIGDFDRVGGWKEFRAAHKGIVTLSVNSGESYDSFVESIAEEFGEQYRVEGDNSGIDSLIAIIEAADSQEARNPVRKTYRDEDTDGSVPDDVDMGVMGGWRDTEVNSIIDRLLDDVAEQIAPDLTFADRKAEEKDAAVKKERAKWEARREQWRAERDKRIAEMKEDKKLAVEAQRAKGEERLRKQAEFYRHQRERSRERRADRESRRKTLARIYKTTQRLSQKLLKPTDSQHIPEKYRKAVADMLGWLDFENARTDAWAKRHGNVPSVRILNMRKLKDIYAQIANDEQLNQYIEPDDQINEWLDFLSDVEGTRLDDLTTEQLRTVRLVLDAISWQVNNADKALTEGLKQSRAEMATELMDELEAQKGEKLSDGVLKKFIKADSTPVHFFDRLGLKVFKKLWQQLTIAQDTHIRHLSEAQEYIEKNITSKWGNTAKVGNNSLIKKWTEESEKYELENGKTVEMTGAQVMSLYALNKREQARKHLLGGGIVIAPTKVKRDLKGGVKEYLLNRELQKTRAELTYADITNILSKMSQEQKDAADAMLRYLKTTSEWGNETSMKLYGYRKFTEENYFPIQSAKEFIAGSNLELQRDKKIKNQGMTKNVNEYANNPIVIDDFFEVTTAHINQMSQYNSFVPILEDFDKIYQYSEYDPETQKYHRSVKELIEQKHGRWAADYIETLLKNVNGNYGNEVADIQGFDRLLRNWKAAKIGLSVRVLAQQPTAVVRAFNEIDPKYFVGTPRRGSHKRMWEICPIAEWKNWGYSQTDIHRSMRDTMMGDKHLTDKLFFDMYGKADNFGWGVIFDAVERETKDLMRKGRLKFEFDSAEYRQHVNERFRQVVDRTQVVDSVLHRSQLMRSQNTLTKAMTSFMAEPTISINTIMTAFSKAQEEARAGHKGAAAKAAARGITVFVANAVAVSAAASLISAIRESYLPDDDDDEEKELSAIQQWLVDHGVEEGSLLYSWMTGYFVEDFKDNINPLMLVPVTKDMLNMLQGYDAPNPMYQLPQSLIKNAQNMKKWIDEDGDTRYSGRYYIERAAESVAELFGIPASNIRKELIGLQNIYFRAISEKEYGDYLQDRWELNEDYKSNKNIFIDHYLNAKKAGHDESAKDIREQLLKSKVRDDDGNLVFTGEAIQKRAWSVYAPNFKDDVIAGRDVSKQEKDLKSVGITAEDIDDKKSKALVSSISDAVEMGDTNRLEDLYGVLGKYGYGEYDVDKMVKSAASDLMYDAIDAENYDDAENYITIITDVTGYTRDDVVSSITTHYMSSYYDAMDAGDQAGVSRVTGILGRYGVTSNAIHEKEAEHYKDYYRQKAYMAYSSGNTAEAYRIATEYNNKYPGVYSKGVDGMIYGIQNLSDETVRRYTTSGKYAEWQLP